MRSATKLLKKSRPASREAMWRAIQARDRRADGQFVYAVSSTGIYCRPSCPSRRPRREHVSFFLLPQAAEAKGFRPCLRCRPQDARIRDPRVGIVASVCRKIESRISADSDFGSGDGNSGLTLTALADASGMAPHQLERAFRRVIGITPRQYADARRMLELKSKSQKRSQRDHRTLRCRLRVEQQAV